MAGGVAAVAFKPVCRSCRRPQPGICLSAERLAGTCPQAHRGFSSSGETRLGTSPGGASAPPTPCTPVCIMSGLRRRLLQSDLNTIRPLMTFTNEQVEEPLFRFRLGTPLLSGPVCLDDVNTPLPPLPPNTPSCAWHLTVPSVDLRRAVGEGGVTRGSFPFCQKKARHTALCVHVNTGGPSGSLTLTTVFTNSTARIMPIFKSLSWTPVEQPRSIYYPKISVDL